MTLGGRAPDTARPPPAPTGADGVSEVDRAQVEGCIEVMCARLVTPVTWAEIADQSYYSPSHLHRLFTRTTTVTPARFLAALRMQRAKHLLAEGRFAVQDVATSVGYQSVGTFTSQFGRHVGVRPGRFRELLDRSAGLTVADLAALASWHVVVPSIRVASSEVAADLDRRVTLVGSFGSTVPSGVPPVFAAIHGTRGGFVAGRHAGADDDPDTDDDVLMATSVRDDTTLAALALGTAPEPLVARVPGEHTAAADLTVTVRRQVRTDPPVVTVAPVAMVLDTVAPVSGPVRVRSGHQGRTEQLGRTGHPRRDG